MLVVAMRRLLALQPGDFGFKPGLLHQARVARGDGLGHGELADLGAGIFDAAHRAVSRECRVDEALLALIVLPHRRVGRTQCRVGVDADFLVLIALAFDTPVPLFDLAGQPRHIQMMQSLQSQLGIHPGAHGVRRADQHGDPARIDVAKQPLFRRRLLEVLHVGDLFRRNPPRDQTVLDPAIGGETAPGLDVQRAEVGEDHLCRTPHRKRRAVRPDVAVLPVLQPDRVDFGDERIQLVRRFVVIAVEDEAEVDRRVAAVGDDREQDIVTLLGLPLALLDKLDPLRQHALIPFEGPARR